MKRMLAIAVAGVAMFMLTPQQAEAQHFHHGFGNGWGGGGVSISVGRGFGPGFVGHPFGGATFGSWHRGISVGFANPPIYRPVPVQSFYRGGIHPGFYGANRGFQTGFYRGGGFGCGW